MDPEKDKKKIKMLTMVGVVLWVIGFIMILIAIFQEFFGYWSDIPDATGSKALMTFKLGGVGFILSGVFMSLIAIVKALVLMPEKLGKLLQK